MRPWRGAGCDKQQRFSARCRAYACSWWLEEGTVKSGLSLHSISSAALEALNPCQERIARWQHQALLDSLVNTSLTRSGATSSSRFGWQSAMPFTCIINYAYMTNTLGFARFKPGQSQDIADFGIQLSCYTMLVIEYRHQINHYSRQ